jgi:ribosomal protein RSM22 (predicted rRNA methylase)
VIDGAVRATPAIREQVRALTLAYRSDGPAAATLGERASVAAYAAARMPATFAAAAAAMTAGAETLPGFAPRTLLDVGAGTGATAWAARAVWPSIASVTLVERERPAIDLGRAVLDGPEVAWRVADVTTADLPMADLVTAGYLVGELPQTILDDVVGRLWAATRGVIVLVEPGSRTGFDRILAARAHLIAAGAHVAAPCPGDEPCPVSGNPRAWCHFLARLDRSSLQRRAKGAELSWEDEPFAYVVAVRAATAVDPRPRIVLGRPRHRPGLVELRVCQDGRIETTVVSRRAGAAYRVARDLTWGDALPVGFPTEG